MSVIFVSYSRSEAPLVGALQEGLKKEEGAVLWVDYLHMKPSQNWDTEWEKAIDRSDAVLVVVSKRSIHESTEVPREINRALEKQRRVVLAIVEAVELPESLKRCAWVDMRGNFKTAVKELGAALRGDQPAGPSPSPPESGFRAPVAVWLTAALAVPVALLSLVVAWTVIIPLLLVPLSVRVLRRDFNYASVRTSLFALPWAVQVVSFFAEDIGEGPLAAAELLTGYAILLCLALYLALRSRPVRRWMRPAAARPVSRRSGSDERKPEKRSFVIDAKPEDVRYARPLERALVAQGHEPTDAPDPWITLRLISVFHDTDEIPADQRVLPVLIQDPDDELPDRLRHTQWIDFRRGIRRSELDAVARSLDEPEELLSSIGIPPPHDQLVMPAGVFALYLGFWAASVGPLSALWFVAYAQLRYNPDQDLSGPFAFVVLAGIVAATSWWATEAVRKRVPGVSLSGLTVAVSLGLLSLVLITHFADTPDDGTADSLVDAAAVAVAFPTFWLPLSWAVFGRSIERWVPAPAQGRQRGLPTWGLWLFRLLALLFACWVYITFR